MSKNADLKYNKIYLYIGTPPSNNIFLENSRRPIEQVHIKWALHKLPPIGSSIMVLPTFYTC